MASPLLWSICNHIDKIILEKYFKEGGVGALIIVSALASVIATPFLYLFDPSVMNMHWDSLRIVLVIAVLDNRAVVGLLQCGQAKQIRRRADD
jgi:hypothetical protein